MVTLFVSNFLLALVNHHSLFISDSLFCYSAFLAIVLFGSKFLNTKIPNQLAGLVSAALTFWLWTNFGTWLFGGIYSFSLHGLIECYIAALPFLRNTLIGSLLWFFPILVCMTKHPKEIKNAII